MSNGFQPRLAANQNVIGELQCAAEKLSADALAEAALTDAPDSFPEKTFARLAENGWLESVFPKRYGGGGLGIENSTTFELLTLLKTFGYGNLVVGRLAEGHFNAAQLIGEFGTEAQIERFSADAASGEFTFGVWNTEAGDGVKIAPDGDGVYRLTGAKTFASGSGFVNRPVVTGRTPDGGWQMFVAPLEKMTTQVDESFWKPLGMRSSRSFRVDFTGAKISAADLIGAPDDYYRQPFFSGGAIRFAAVQLGAAELLFDLTRDFLRELNRADDVFQRTRAGDAAIGIESGNLFLREAARNFDNYLMNRNPSKISAVLAYAGMTRTAIERVCQDAMAAAARSVGSRGLLPPYHFERVIRDLTMYLRQAAPDATLNGIGEYVLQNDASGGRARHAENE